MMATDTSQSALALAQDILTRSEAAPIHTKSVDWPGGQTWWLSPHPLSRQPGVLKVGIDGQGKDARAGYRLEKGMSTEARAYNIPTSYVMYTPWPLMTLASDAEFLETFNSLIPTLPLHIWLQVTNGLVPGSGFNPFATPFRHQFHWTVKEHGQLELAEAVYDIGVIGDVKKSASVPEAITYLEKLPEWRWYWVSLFFGVQGRDITEDNLQKLLPPFLRWWQ